MLKNTKAYSGFSVDDIGKARSFYQETLGLKVKNTVMGFIELHIEGGNPIMVYPKQDHKAATYTVLNFPVEDVEVAVDALLKKGIIFEQYKALKTDDKGISRHHGSSIAWFKDPAGNILSIIED